MHAAQLPVLYGESGLAEYLDRIRQLPFLSQDEEYTLAKRWTQNQDIIAAQQLALSHLRLVAKIAFGFKGYGLPLSDLISEGNIGLLQAIKRFDPERGFRLATYAMWWIKASMQEYVLRSWSMVKVGTTAAQKKLFFNLRRLKQTLLASESRALTQEETKMVADELDVSEADVGEMESRFALTDRSADDRSSSYEGDEGDALVDTIAADITPQDEMVAEAQEGDSRRKWLALAMDSALNERERYILIHRRLGDEDAAPATLETLSERFGVSRERIRQIEERALEKVRDYVLNASGAKALPAA